MVTRRNVKQRSEALTFMFCPDEGCIASLYEGREVGMLDLKKKTSERVALKWRICAGRPATRGGQSGNCPPPRNF